VDEAGLLIVPEARRTQADLREAQGFRAGRAIARERQS